MKEGPDLTFERTFAKLYRLFYYRGVPQYEVEDLVQEVYLRFFRKYGVEAFEAEDEIKLLYGFARNVYREWVRLQLKSGTVEWDDDIASPVEAEELEEGYAEDLEELGARARAAIRELPNERMRVVLEMRFLDDRTRAEVAEHLGISEKAVHVYQRRGIAALQKSLLEALSDEGSVSLPS